MGFFIQYKDRILKELLFLAISCVISIFVVVGISMIPHAEGTRPFNQEEWKMAFGAMWLGVYLFLLPLRLIVFMVIGSIRDK